MRKHILAWVIKINNNNNNNNNNVNKAFDLQVQNDKLLYFIESVRHNEIMKLN